MNGFIDNGKTGTLNGLPIHRPAEVLPPPAGVTVIIASMFAGAIAGELRSRGVSDWVSAAPLIRNVIQAEQARGGPNPILAALNECVLVLCAFVVAVIARFRAKTVDVGIGPECLINNQYHKRALLHAGYSAETFVIGVTHVTQQFDHVFIPRRIVASNVAVLLRVFHLAATRYRLLYVYFGGGPFYASRWAWRVEPLLFAIARTRIVVLPYGQDIQDFTRCPNLPFKHATTVDYPFQNRDRQRIADRIDLWTRGAGHVVSGCDWVDYMHHWDTLIPGHFAIDADGLRRRAEDAISSIGAGSILTGGDAPVRIVHAPNHRTIKGTPHVVAAVERLREEGIPVELTIVEAAANQTVLEQMARADIVVDQLVIGWYAMVAIEAMALGKPVVCYIRPDLHALYVGAGVLAGDELPLVMANPETLADALRPLIADRERRRALGVKGQAYVRDRHSITTIGAVFAAINQELGVPPSGPVPPAPLPN
ncbi:glycosyltransferase [Azospirillum himalayense]|uniref:Glycosyltransferase n=1 Tax=Azospirillum himalayense TaxID=654847 RepID=A0ABW0FZS1_9PROT